MDGDFDWDTNAFAIYTSESAREWSKFSVAATEQILGVDRRIGLTTSDANERRQRYGVNELQGQGSPTFPMLLLRHFLDFLMILLVAAGVTSLALGEYVDGAVILAIAIVNVFVGALQEFRAEQSLEALKNLSGASAVVLRDGELKEIPSSELVPGDVIELAFSGAASAVSADARVVDVSELETVETVLTGESRPIKKKAEAFSPLLVGSDEANDSFASNMVFSGTSVSSGRGRAIVVSTGMQTELGKIAASVNSSRNKHAQTDMQKELQSVSIVLFVIGLVFAFVVFASTAFEASNIRYTAVYAVALIVAIIPEELPLAMTLTLILGVRRMAKSNVIVRQMSALEQLGRVSNICSDKTGTITQGAMSVTQVWVPESASILPVQGKQIALEQQFSASLRMLALVALKCNSGRGQHTDAALLEFATSSTLLGERDASIEVVKQFPFDSKLKRMTVIVRGPKNNNNNDNDNDNNDDDGGRLFVLTKGATEAVLPLCIEPTSEEGVAQIHDQTRRMASQGLRVLLFAFRDAVEADLFGNREEVEERLICAGAVGLQDPPRVGVKEAVEECLRGGITVRMLTGDDVQTAFSIARSVSILNDKDTAVETIGTIGAAMHAREFDKVTDEALDQYDALPRVIARCTPDSKVKMIQGLRRRELVSAMTGDGVNDAPALSAAHVGIAMGVSGSDVTRQVAHIVLSDDNFVSIVAGIREGRRIFYAIQKFVVHVLGTNVGMVILLMSGLAFRESSGLIVFPQSALEILVLNMFVLSVPLVGLVMEPPDFDVMAEPPRKSRRVLIPALLADILITGLLLGACSVAVFTSITYGVNGGVFVTGNCTGVPGVNTTRVCNCNSPAYFENCEGIFGARGATFLAMALMIVFNAFNCRYAYEPFWHNLRGVTRAFVIGVLVVLIVVFILIYVPVLNVNVMHQSILSWQLGFSFAALFVYVILVSIWKLAVRPKMFPRGRF